MEGALRNPKAIHVDRVRPRSRTEHVPRACANVPVPSVTGKTPLFVPVFATVPATVSVPPGSVTRTLTLVRVAERIWLCS